jgi:hypothetical protein
MKPCAFNSMGSVLGWCCQNHFNYRQLNWLALTLKASEIAEQVLEKILIKLLESVVCSFWHLVPLALLAFWIDIF